MSIFMRAGLNYDDHEICTMHYLLNASCSGEPNSMLGILDSSSTTTLIDRMILVSLQLACVTFAPQIYAIDFKPQDSDVCCF